METSQVPLCCGHRVVANTAALLDGAGRDRGKAAEMHPPRRVNLTEEHVRA